MDFNSPRLLLSFPIELLTEIIQLADLDTRSSLCRVSKGLSSLSTPILYRDILLKSSSSVVKCLSTLSTCSSSARYVKMLHIAYNTAQASTEDNIIESVELIKNALACLPNILRLAINPPTNERDAYELAICSTTFDKLDTFIWSSKFTVELLEFLARHHQKLITVGFNFEPLEQIQIHRYSLENVEAIVLPKLVKFYGELHHVRLLGASETLKSVTAQWTGNVEDLVGFEKSIMCLGQAKNLVEFDLLWPVVDITHLDIISRHLGTVQDLSIGLSSIYAREDESNDTRIQTALSRFPELRLLTIRNAGHLEPGKGKASLDEDYKAVTVWSDSCPSLCICSTPRNTRWVRSKEGNLEWLPTPLVGNARIWLKNALLKEMNPGWKEKMRKCRPRIQDTLAIENPELSELLAYSDDEREEEAQTQSEPENNSMEAASEDTQP